MWVIDFIKRSIESHRERSRLADIARNAFVAKYPDRRLLGWRPLCQEIPNGDWIVSLFWWNDRIPPPCCWWRVAKSTSLASELTYQEAKELIDIPLRR